MTQTATNKRQEPSQVFFTQPSTSKPLIMIVGMDEDTRLMLRLILEMWSYDVLEAATIEDSINMGRERPPSVILMDTTTTDFSESLGDMSRIKHSDGLGDIPSVMISGFSQSPYRRAAFTSGASAFLVKPVDFDLLHDYIKTLVSEKHPH